MGLSESIVETPSSFAAEGTAAHILSERCLTTGHDAARFKGYVVDTAAKQHPITPGGIPNGTTKFRVDATMVDAVQVYIDEAMRIYEESEEFEVEQRLDLTEIVGGVFGTGDVIAYRSTPTRRVTIADLKYGQGVAVDVRNNKQLLTYALGVCQRYHNRGVDEIEIVIVQPRAPRPGDSPPGVRRWVTDIVGLYEHAMALQDAAIVARSDDAPFLPGREQCNFCRAAGVCRALRDKVMEITMADPVAPYKDWKLERDDIELVKTWARRREEHAHSEALRGNMPPGAKLVAKRATRQWRDADVAVTTLQIAGVSDDDIFETSLRSPAQIEKAIPKKDRDALLAELAVKQSSGTTLAPLDDPRPTASDAANGFEAVVIGEQD